MRSPDGSGSLLKGRPCDRPRRRRPEEAGRRGCKRRPYRKSYSGQPDSCPHILQIETEADAQFRRDQLCDALLEGGDADAFDGFV